MDRAGGRTACHRRFFAQLSAKGTKKDHYMERNVTRSLHFAVSFALPKGEV